MPYCNSGNNTAKIKNPVKMSLYNVTPKSSNMSTVKSFTKKEVVKLQNNFVVDIDNGQDQDPYESRKGSTRYKL